jgi:transposase
LVQGHSQRAAAKRFGVSRETVARLLAEPPAENERRYRRKTPRPAPVRAAVLPKIEGWLAENARLQRWAPKQRWTARRMWQELRAEGIAVAESTVRQLVRERRQRKPAAYVTLTFGPGERAEIDFGHAAVVLAGVAVEVPFLAARLRYSGAMFVECFPTERQDAFLLGQRHAFEFWGGAPRSACFDNLKPAVLALLQGRRRVEQQAFAHFRSAYCFEAVFTNAAAGWEKGSVENLVGFARRTYMVPPPVADDFTALNAVLRERCLADQRRVMAGRETPIVDRLATERTALLPLPARPLDVSAVRAVLARSTARVRFETNEYSVPVRYVGQTLTLRADPFMVQVFAGAELIAEHARCYERQRHIEDFRHFVPVLLEKPGAIPFAAVLRNGQLPPAWEAFRRQLVARREDGNREFARILHLCLAHPVAAVGAALELAAAADAYSADAVRQLLHWATEEPAGASPLDPARYPAYQQRQPAPDLAVYDRLLERAAPAGQEAH